jgi:cytochrome c-type biogenesis protein CcmH
MREIIREQLQAGKSREEIVGYFVARYGDYVLMKPPYQGPGFVLWVTPALVLLGLVLFAFFYIRRRQGRSLPPPPELSEEDLARVRAARSQD